MIAPAYRLQKVVYRHILHIPDLTVPAGTLYCITGRSGSGKSTLLKLLNNMITCDEGSIFFFGDNLLALSPVELRRRAVMVPQNPAMFPGTAGQNMLKAMALAGKKVQAEWEAGVEKTLSALGLTGILDRPAASLSGGEKHRLALARALILDSPVLLLDEPTAALDGETERIVMDYLAGKLRESGKTAVVATHSITLASRYGDFVLTLFRGRPPLLEERRASV